MSSQPSLARLPSKLPRNGDPTELVPAHLSQWVCIFGTAGLWQPAKQQKLSSRVIQAQRKLAAPFLPTNTESGVPVLKYIVLKQKNVQGFPDGSVVKNLLAKEGDTGLIPDPGSSHMPQSS